MEELELIVKEATSQDGKVYLNSEDIRKLDVNIGGTVRVGVPRGNDDAFVVGEPEVENVKEGEIHIKSSIINSLLNARPGDLVKVSKIRAPEAEKVVVKIQSEGGPQMSQIGLVGSEGGPDIKQLISTNLSRLAKDSIISKDSVMKADLGQFLTGALGQQNMGGNPFSKIPMSVKVNVVDYTPSDSDYVRVTQRTNFIPESSDYGGGGLMGNEPQGGIQIEQEGEESMEMVPEVGYEDIGGLETEIEKTREMIELPMKFPEIFETAGIEPPKGLLFHGPPGTGKTLLARALANEIDASFHTISGPEIMSKYYGQSEEKLRELFEEAQESTPAIIFIDELDAIAPKRNETQGSMETRVVSQLLSLMDGLESRGDVVVIAATNRLDSVDIALRRGGRFDREIEIGPPNREGRKEILQIHTRGMKVEDDFDPEDFASRTQGFVGADIEVLCKEAAMNAIRRIKPEIDFEKDNVPQEILDKVTVKVADFENALLEVEPSAMREVFVETPEVGYEDIGGLEDVKSNLTELVEWPMKHRNMFDHLDLDESSGILLYGPPGTGKTLLAKAISNESDANFISIKGPELLDKYVGESEKGVREVFKKARQNSPSVIFFDEIDSIASERGRGGGDTQVTERVVSQLLTELDGVEDMEGVKVIAATNRPDLIDSALLRTGRLDKMVEVGFPNTETREEIFNIHLSSKPVGDDVDVSELAMETEGYTGSDIAAICREASMSAMREQVAGRDETLSEEEIEQVVLKREHFDEAMKTVNKSISEDDKEKYAEMSERVGRDEMGDIESKTFM